MHDQPFIQAKFGFESGFPIVTLLYANLIVTTFETDFGKNSGTAKLIKHIIKAWNGVPISNGDSIDGSTIGTHAKATVSFWHKNDRYGTRAQTFTHMTMVYEML